MHRVSRVVCRQLDNLLSLYQGKVLHKASQTLQDPSHPSMSNFIHDGSFTEAAHFYSLTSRQTATSIRFLPSVVSILKAKLDRNMLLNNL